MVAEDFSEAPMPLSYFPSGSIEGTSEGTDPFASIVENLLRTVETSPTPTFRKAGVGQRILGSLSDALLNYANIQSGGAAQEGPFRRGERERELRFQAESRASEEANRDLRNRIRLMGAEARLKPSPRPFRPQLKTFIGKDASGRPVEVPYLFSPQADGTASLSPMQGYEAGFQKYVRPFLAQGVNMETGELEFKLVDPLLGLGQADATEPDTAGGVPEATPSVRTVPGIEPKPPTGEVEAAEAATVIQEQLSRFGQLASKYAGNERTLGTARSLGQGVVRSVPGGQVLTESFGDPDFEELSALRDRIGQQLARLVENGRLSDQDREFALRNLPSIPALTTEAGRQSAAAKIALVEKEIATRLSRKRRLRPGLMGEAVPRDSAGKIDVDAILRKYEEEYGGAEPTP